MTALVISLAALIASMLTLFSGFGLGTLLMPIVALFFPIEVAISITAIVHLANNVFKVGLVGRNASWITVFQFGAPAVLAATARVEIVRSEDSASLKIVTRSRAVASLVEEEVAPGRDATTDEDLMQFIRQTGGTVYHPCGTNRMGSDERSVVDPTLRVRGVEGLRVADASVFPTMPSSNIQPAVIMTGERCAELIRTAA
jgi:hypothetical protein